MKQQLVGIFVASLMLVCASACAFAPVQALNAMQTTEDGAPGIPARTVSNENADAVAQEGQMVTSATPAPVKPDKSEFKLAQEISSDTWINSGKINWSDLRGKVVVVDFWTFACYNCKNTLPYKKDWYSKYADKGLVIIGVHTPELSFEKVVDNVRKAVQDYGIRYPIAIDGDYSNWRRYNVWAWPTWFIVDKEGYVRYTHIGEGDYAGSEKMIQQLLAE